MVDSLSIAAGVFSIAVIVTGSARSLTKSIRDTKEDPDANNPFPGMPMPFLRSNLPWLLHLTNMKFWHVVGTEGARVEIENFNCPLAHCQALLVQLMVWDKEKPQAKH